jgi:hypothetical protein
MSNRHMRLYRLYYLVNNLVKNCLRVILFESHYDRHLAPVMKIFNLLLKFI